jgi:hypothetical protein
MLKEEAKRRYNVCVCERGGGGQGDKQAQNAISCRKVSPHLLTIFDEEEKKHGRLKKY